MLTLFLATVYGVPLLQSLLGDTARSLDVAAEVLPEAARSARQEGLFAANSSLATGLERLETTFEEDSFLRRWVLPPTQHLLTELLGVGNEQVYLGRDGWLFFREDFDHVTGPGFLEPQTLRKEHLEGIRTADPLPAILRFHRDLRAHGIELVVMPTLVKPTVHPEFLSAKASGEILIHNPSFATFLDRLEAAGVTVIDSSTAFAAAKARGEGPLYLRTDTHWSPTTVELVARGLASVLEDRVEWSGPSNEQFFRRRASVSGLGDTARMLDPRGPRDPSASERTEVSRVTTRRGLPWRPDRRSEVLLLGDSFTNIYSDATLGWGTGAGLAEQLSFELGRPVDRIALNAGGSWSSRQALARGMTADGGPGQLAGKQVVVYQFAARELSTGDWKVLEIPSQKGP